MIKVILVAYVAIAILFASWLNGMDTFHAQSKVSNFGIYLVMGAAWPLSMPIIMAAMLSPRSIWFQHAS